MPDDLDAIIAQQAAAHPEPDNMAPAVLQSAEPQPAAPAPGAVGPDGVTPLPSTPDASGAMYDPTRHAWPPDMTTRGTWRMRRGAIEGAAAIAAGPDPAVCAANWADAAFGIMQAIGGAEWEPSETERQEIRRNLARVLQTHGCADLPPGWALCLAAGVYALPRIMQPGMIGRMLARFRPAKHGSIAGEATQLHADDPNNGLANAA